MHMYELKCSSSIAYLNAFSQILFKHALFQSEPSARETQGRLYSCSFGSISEQLSHSQKGLRSTGHHWDKNTTGLKQGQMLRHIICGTLSALNSHYAVSVKLPKSKLLTHVTDKANLHFASVLLKDF